MKKPEAILIGYFPKRVMLRPDWLKNSTVTDICSVSECMSKGPDNWIDHWKHNTTWWMFDAPEIAREATGDDRDFTVFAYKLFPVLFEGCNTVPLAVVSTARNELNHFVSIGYDIVSRSCGTNFECSPLSCNNGCEKFPVNRHCLINDLDSAWETAQIIARESEANGSWEPGPYCLIEVLRQSITSSG